MKAFTEFRIITLIATAGLMDRSPWLIVPASFYLAISLLIFHGQLTRPALARTEPWTVVTVIGLTMYATIPLAGQLKMRGREDHKRISARDTASIMSCQSADEYVSSSTAN